MDNWQETRAAWGRLMKTMNPDDPMERAFAHLLITRAVMRVIGVALVSCTAGYLLGVPAFILVVGAALWLEGADD